MKNQTVYVYTDGWHDRLMTFDELELTTDVDGCGTRVPYEMNEEQFLAYLLTQEWQMAEYWYVNGASTAWFKGDIEVYDERHQYWEQLDDHREYFDDDDDEDHWEDPKELEREYMEMEVESWGNFIDISGPPQAR